jgi:hypothetical protein
MHKPFKCNSIAMQQSMLHMHTQNTFHFPIIKHGKTINKKHVSTSVRPFIMCDGSLAIYLSRLIELKPL